MGNSIQLTTRRNIIDSYSVTRIPWYGDMEQPTFLARLFDLSKLPSTDHRYKTAGEDIHKHTVMNDDWPEEWVFSDSRFNLLHVNDALFLDFLGMTIHPAVRSDEKEVSTLMEIYQNNLLRDGFELKEVSEIAGRPVFEGGAVKKKAVYLW